MATGCTYHVQEGLLEIKLPALSEELHDLFTLIRLSRNSVPDVEDVRGFQRRLPLLEVFYPALLLPVVFQGPEANCEHFRSMLVDVCLVEFGLNGIHLESKDGPSQDLANEEEATHGLHLFSFNLALSVHAPLVEYVDFCLHMVLEQQFLQLDVVLVLLGAFGKPVLECGLLHQQQVFVFNMPLSNLQVAILVEQKVEVSRLEGSLSPVDEVFLSLL